MKNTINIRSFERTDLADVMTIWWDASAISHDFLPVDIREKQKRAVEEIIPQADTWVAEKNGAVVGFIGFIGNFLGGLFVAPDQQGHGIGLALLKHGAAARDELLLEVYARNTQACGFYHRCGFEEVSQTDHDNETGLPLKVLTLRKTIQTH